VAQIKKLLVANRGEIARRIFRAARAMGIDTVAVYSDADVDAPHVNDADEAVRIGPAPSRESYLAIDRVLDAARATGADAVHPGYGFLAENAEFARRCGDAGLAFVGPPVEAIRKMGNKVEAKALMAAAGVPVLPDVTRTDLSAKQLAAEAKTIGYPILVKAAAGGGGRGMRVVEAPAGLREAVQAARREAANAFGDDAVFLERYVEAPRHVEIQVLGDMAGNVIHLFERECSIQRRHQKIIEEAPSVAVDEALRMRMGEAAVAAARAVGYVGAGTVEFLLDRDGQFYFLEMNTRLQVEHPVTEAVTRTDLVQLQLRIAQGEPLPVRQSDLGIDGHAIEARLCAEDPAKDFLPVTGRLSLWQPAALPGLRYDSGVVTGIAVGVHYDSLLAKIIAHGATRRDAIDRITRALASLGVAGVATNRDFLLAILKHPAFAEGEIDTHFIERHLPPERRTPAPNPARDRVHAIVAALHAQRSRRGSSPLPSSIPSGWRNNRWRAQDVSYWTGDGDARVLEVHYTATGDGRFEVTADGQGSQALVAASSADTLVLEVDGVRRRYVVAGEADAPVVHGPLGTTALRCVPRFPERGADAVAGGCVAPMTGLIRDIRVAVGDRVEPGQVLLVLEAMKTEIEMTARATGIVKAIQVEVGQMVDPDVVLVVVEGEE
jgi:propionyl-CoA carboxylase alpha chain